MKKEVKKWIINVATLAALSAGGFTVGHFSPQKGYPVIDTVTVPDTIWFRDTVAVTVRDTIWFRDSLKLVDFARLGRFKLGDTGVRLK